MPDWIVERGIGETRAVRVTEGEIVEARILLDGTVAAGTLLGARLARSGTPAVAVADGVEYLLPQGAPGATEGAAITIEVSREAIPGVEPWKRPLARIGEPTAAPIGPFANARPVAFPSPDDALERAGWSDLIDEARSGIVRFAGGELRVSPTPAMTLIDVDGTLAPAELALAGAKAAARAILRHGIGGSIGIDFPTVQGKAPRQATADAIASILPQPFERTAVNGFGFLQIVRPRRHASLFELAADRACFEARALLRRAAGGTGTLRLAAHPAVIAALNNDWLAALSRQVGGEVSLRTDASLPISAGHAEPA